MVALVLTGLTACAQNDDTHLEFRGIPIDGKIDSFVNKLERLGYTVSKQAGSNVIMKGTFAGKDATLFILGTPKTNTVWKVAVNFSEASSWSSIKSDYKYYKEMFTKKYGTPKDVYEFFAKPYYEGDGYELQALRVEKCFYFTSYEVTGGTIVVQMSRFEYIQIIYEDSQNYTIKSNEENDAVIDDI